MSIRTASNYPEAPTVDYDEGEDRQKQPVPKRDEESTFNVNICCCSFDIRRATLGISGAECGTCAGAIAAVIYFLAYYAYLVHMATLAIAAIGLLVKLYLGLGAYYGRHSLILPYLVWKPLETLMECAPIIYFGIRWQTRIYEVNTINRASYLPDFRWQNSEMTQEELERFVFLPHHILFLMVVFLCGNILFAPFFIFLAAKCYGKLKALARMKPQASKLPKEYEVQEVTLDNPTTENATSIEDRGAVETTASPRSSTTAEILL